MRGGRERRVAGYGDRMSGEDEGQVSEVQRMTQEGAGTPVSDDQAVAGQPDGESGDVQEGPTGPDAEVPGAADEHPEVVRRTDRR